MPVEVRGGFKSAGNLKEMRIRKLVNVEETTQKTESAFKSSGY